MKLTITQKPKDGFLCGPKSKSFSICHNTADYEININQCDGQRTTIVSSESGTYVDTLDIYYSLESLLMLFDGQFYPVVSALDGDTEITQSWKQRALPSYISADFMIGSGNSLINFEAVLNAELFQKWHTLKEELDLIHKMVLYCLSNVQMPKDMQCAFMVEAFEGLAYLVTQRKPEIIFPKANSSDSQLRLNLLTFINQFGSAIFEKETQRDIDKLTQIFVDSRNRIAHIKSKQTRVYLDGGESVIYLMKLSLLYRVVLFSLLGIAESCYQDKLGSYVQSINEHKVTRKFLEKLEEQAN